MTKRPARKVLYTDMHSVVMLIYKISDISIDSDTKLTMLCKVINFVDEWGTIDA